MTGPARPRGRRRIVPTASREIFRPGPACGSAPRRNAPRMFSGRTMWRVRIAAAQRDDRRDLPLGKIRIAEIVAGIADLDADRARVDVGVAAPGRHPGVPGAVGSPAPAERSSRFRARDSATRRGRSGRTAGAIASCGELHAGVVQHDHVGARQARRARRNWARARRARQHWNLGVNCVMSATIRTRRY